MPASAGSTRCSRCARLNATCVATVPASLRRLLARLLASSDSVAHAGGDATQLASLQRSFTWALRRIRRTTRIGGVGAAAAALLPANTAVLDRIASALEDLVDVKRYEVYFLPFLPPFGARLTVCRAACLPLWQMMKRRMLRMRRAVLLSSNFMLALLLWQQDSLQRRWRRCISF